MASFISNHLAFSLKPLQALKLKHVKNFKLKKSFLYWYYRRFGYHVPYFSGKRGVRLRRFFSYRVFGRYTTLKSSLRSDFIFFLRRRKRAYYRSTGFLKKRTFLLALDFYKNKLFFFKRKKSFFLKRGHAVALQLWSYLLLRAYTRSRNQLFYFNSCLPYVVSFLVRNRLRLLKPKLLYFRKLRSAAVPKKIFFVSSLRKNRRVLRSLFHRLSIAGPKKIFFITLRSSKNNTMLSVFDFLGNLLYWKTSKAVGMSGKKKSTKMAAEFLAYHLMRYLRARKFYNHRFIFTLFGLHRNFKVVFRFIKKNVWRKKIIAMLNKSTLPHGGCYIKKRKHKGRKKHRRRAFIYY